MTQCRLRTEDGEEILGLEELEARLRTGAVSGNAWLQVEGLTPGFVRVRDSAFFSRFDPLPRARFRQAFALNRVPWVALSITLTCVALHLLAEQWTQGTPSRDVLLQLGARARTSVLWDGEPWRLWTGALLHRDRLHLAFNSAVFLAVGGALESIYPRTGMLGVVIWGVLCSGLLSLWVGPQVTVGLSGVVFAALGACVGFGARFRDVLRSPYQTWFGLAALVYALFALWSGARQPEVDHAGHLGGLLGGLVLGLLLPPRHWPTSRALDPGVLVAGLLASALAVVVLGLAPRKPELMMIKVGQYGVSLPVPAGFMPARDALGWSAYDNGLDAQVALGCARAELAWPRPGRQRGAGMDLARELAKEAPKRDVEDFTYKAIGWTQVGGAVGPGWPAQELAVSYTLPTQTVEARLLVFERGLIRCALSLASRRGAAQPRNALMEGVRTHVLLTPTDALLHAQAMVAADPSSLMTQLDLGLAALHAGDVSAARVALRAVVAAASEDGLPAARAHYALAQTGLLTLEGREALRHASKARDLLPLDVDVAVALYGAYRINGLHQTPAARLLADALQAVRPSVLRR